MKLKILAIEIILIMVSSAFIVTAETINDDIKITSISDVNLVEIRAAVLSVSTYSGYIYFLKFWDGYQWRVGNTTYKFTLHWVSDKDILCGKLTTENYDLFNIPANEGNQFKRSLPSLQNKIWKRKIANFIKDGGGYIGYCGGSTIVMGTYGKRNTLLGRLLANCDLGISHVKRFYDDLGYKPSFFESIPFLCQLSGKPESLGIIAYDYCGGRDPNNESQWIGVPVDFDINRDNPIFDDLLEEKRRIYWCSGAAFTIPDEQKDNVTVLVRYPEKEISKNESTQIHAWKYTGGIRGFITAFLKAKKEGYNSKDALSLSIFKATDWEMMIDKLIEFNRSNKPMMTMETYPNENHGRIVLTAGHPEICVWWGGHIEDAPDNDNNNLFDGLYTWKNITPWNETVEDEQTYNWWIVYRQAAWVSKKVPDNDLPPVYGPSQVSDIYPYKQTSPEFTIIGNAEISDGIVSLDLYYQFSLDNETEHWSDWTIYGTDNDAGNGWSWDFNASLADGPGYYQFYSIRHAQNGYQWSNETAPPGPDAIAYVNNG